MQTAERSAQSLTTILVSGAGEKNKGTKWGGCEKYRIQYPYLKWSPRSWILVCVENDCSKTNQMV